MSICRKVRVIREQIGMSIADVAFYTGLDIEDIYKFESGDENVTLRFIKQIADFYNVHLSDLFTDKLNTPLMMMPRYDLKIINFTGHPITILDEMHKVIRRIPSKEYKAEIFAERRIEHIYGIPFIDHVISGVPRIVEKNTGKPNPIPGKEEGVVYVANQAFVYYIQRLDFWHPGEIVRSGRKIIGCVGLAKNAYLYRGGRPTIKKIL